MYVMCWFQRAKKIRPIGQDRRRIQTDKPSLNQFHLHFTGLACKHDPSSLLGQDVDDMGDGEPLYANFAPEASNSVLNLLGI